MDKLPTRFVMVRKHEDDSYSMTAGLYDSEKLKAGVSPHEASQITDKAEPIVNPKLLEVAKQLIP